MHGQCCLKLLEMLFRAKEIEFVNFELGIIEISEESWDENSKKITDILHEAGLYIIQNPDDNIVEEIKKAIHGLIFESGYNVSMIRNSDFLVEKTGYSYQRLAKLFMQSENTTIEKYIIREKVERVKQLITGNELSLSEIAYMLGYSSVHYLSTQFKLQTGTTVSEFKQFNGSQE